MTPEERMARAARYRSWMDDADITRSFDDVRNTYVRAWEQAGTVDEREACWRAVKVVDQVRNHIGRMISDGMVAQREIAQMQGKKRLFSR